MIHSSANHQQVFVQEHVILVTIAGKTGCTNIVSLIKTALGEWNYVVDGQTLGVVVRRVRRQYLFADVAGKVIVFEYFPFGVVAGILSYRSDHRRLCILQCLSAAFSAPRRHSEAFGNVLLIGAERLCSQALGASLESLLCQLQYFTVLATWVAAAMLAVGIPPVWSGCVSAKIAYAFFLPTFWTFLHPRQLAANLLPLGHFSLPFP